MKFIPIPLILLMWGCATPASVIQNTLDNTFRRDSMTVEYKPQTVLNPASRDTAYTDRDGLVSSGLVFTVEPTPPPYFKIDSNGRVWFDTTQPFYKAVREYFAPQFEKYKTPDGKTNVTIDRTDRINPKAIIDRKDDSIRTLVRELSYFKSEERFKQETKTVESDDLSTKEMFLYAFGLVGMILLITVLRR